MRVAWDPANSGAAISRREAIRVMGTRGLLAATGSLALGAISRASAPALPAQSSSGRGLVVLHLRGGADALELCIPVGDPRLDQIRPDLARVGRSSSARRLNRLFALPPAMASLAQLMNEGRLKMMHGVGPSRAGLSHAQARAELQSAACRAVAGTLESQVVGRPSASFAALESSVVDRARNQPDSGNRHGVVVFEHLGWDTHTQQRSSIEQTMFELSQWIITYDQWARRTPVNESPRLVIVSEFGRSMAMNNQGGTEHGWGGIALVYNANAAQDATVGARVKMPRWPGLWDDRGMVAEISFDAILNESGVRWA